MIKFQSPDYLLKVSKVIEKPYFLNFYLHFGIYEENDQLEILKYIYGNDITILQWKNIYDSNGFLIYYEMSDGYWCNREFNNKGKIIYSEDSNGGWFKKQFDSNNIMIYYENNYGIVLHRKCQSLPPISPLL